MTAPVASPSRPAAVPSGTLVMVVDDDPMVRRLVRAVLEVDGVEVIEAADGHGALDIAGDVAPAVVVLDVMMPGLSGVEVCRLLDHGRMKVVILTARDDRQLDLACREAGADAFLTKPFSSDELLAVLAEVIGGR
ncbi:MAG TPA: response regulator [Acidimicrobiales bacterium]|nr:response regulator [Acidimicrobiales bacterium]